METSGTQPEPVQSQTQEPTQAPPVEEAKPALSSKEQFKQELLRQLQERAAPKPVEVPQAEEPKTEPTPDWELKLAKSQRALKDAEADLLAAKEASTKYNELQDKLSTIREDPYAAIMALKELIGRDLGELVQYAYENADQIKSKRQFADLPDEVRQELELSRKERAERQRLEQESKEKAEKSQKFQTYETKIKEHVEQNSSDYPLVSALEWAVQDVALQLVQTNQNQATPILQKMEQTLQANACELLGNEKVLNHLIATNQDLKQKVLAALQLPKPSTSQTPSQTQGHSERGNSPTLTNNITSSGSVPAPLNARELFKQQLKEAMELERQRNNG